MSRSVLPARPKPARERVAAGFFDVGEDFEGGRDAEAGVESHDAGDGFLPVGLEGVWAGVGRVERGMGLEDEVHLAGEPDAGAGEVGEHGFGGLDAGVGVVSVGLVVRWCGGRGLLLRRGSGGLVLRGSEGGGLLGLRGDRARDEKEEDDERRAHTRQLENVEHESLAQMESWEFGGCMLRACDCGQFCHRECRVGRVKVSHNRCAPRTGCHAEIA